MLAIFSLPIVSWKLSKSRNSFRGTVCDVLKGRNAAANKVEFPMGGNKCVNFQSGLWHRKEYCRFILTMLIHTCIRAITSWLLKALWLVYTQVPPGLTLTVLQMKFSRSINTTFIFKKNRGHMFQHKPINVGNLMFIEPCIILIVE